MIGKKSMLRLQRRLLRPDGGLHRMDPDKAGLSISDYNALCNACNLQPGRHAKTAGSGRSIILK